MKKKLLAVALVIVLAMSQIIPVFAVESKSGTQPSIIVSDVEGKAGETVSVTVGLANNPGIVSMTLHMTYDTDILTLKSVKDAGVFGSQFHKPEYTSPYTLCWANDASTTNYTMNGTIATLEFEISETAKEGAVAPIEITYDLNNYEIYNVNLETIDFTIDNGSVTVATEEVPVTLSSIGVSKQPTKTIYQVGETLDTTGLELQLTYSDSSAQKITSGFTTSGFDSSTTGTKTVTVSYEGKTTTFTVLVEAAPITLSSIAVSKQPTKTIYQVGEALDITGLELQLTYSDSSTQKITSGFTTSGFSSSTAGTKMVTVSYGGKTTTFSVMVNEKVVDENVSMVYAENITARPGDTIAVPIYIKNNSGAAYLKLKVSYGDEFELISAEDTLLLGGSFTGSKTIDTNPYVLQWSNAGDMTANGNIAILTFKVADVLADGQYNITITCEEAYDQEFQDVIYQVTSPVITVRNFVYGDINDDDKINGKDAIILNQYLAEWGTEINTLAADVNADGKVNGKDVIVMNQYLAEWGIELGKAGN